MPSNAPRLDPGCMTASQQLEGHSSVTRRTSTDMDKRSKSFPLIPRNSRLAFQQEMPGWTRTETLEQSYMILDKSRSCGLSFGKSMDDIFEKLQDDTSSLWQSPAESVKRLKQVPSAATFFKEYVATSTPVIIAGGASAWKATSSWDLDSLARENPELEVTVDWTPNGRGDCVVEDDEPDCPVFVKSEERKMRFKSFVDALHAQGAQSRSDGRLTGGDVCSEDDGVLYLSHQNDNLRHEFPGLVADIEPFLEVAREAFGNEPDAVNLWIGDDRSTSAVHKDHYENMYCVVRGEKHFTLLPPSDVLFLYEQDYPQGRYRRTADATRFDIKREPGTVSWIPVDPEKPDLDLYPLFRYASPVQCTLGPGDILYLPALWYHQVSQRGVTIAVNYWHDMQFDFKYVYYRFMQQLAKKRTFTLTGRRKALSLALKASPQNDDLEEEKRIRVLNGRA